MGLWVVYGKKYVFLMNIIALDVWIILVENMLIGTIFVMEMNIEMNFVIEMNCPSLFVFTLIFAWNCQFYISAIYTLNDKHVYMNLSQKDCRTWTGVCRCRCVCV